MSLVDSLAGHLSASKNRAYQDRARERFFIFVTFLQDNNLVTRQLLAPGEYPDRELVIRYQDLTEDGASTVKAGYNKWLQGIDRGKPASDLGVLASALERVRQQR